MDKLKPCPFCGNDKVIIGWTIEGYQITGIYCTKCKAMTKWPVPEWRGRQTAGEYIHEWTERWNRRNNDVV